jgi:multiple sugar transport system substrate-binding protein
MRKGQKKYYQLIGLFLVMVFFVTTGFGCALLTSEQQAAVLPITLTYWRVWDDQDAFDEIIKDYQVVHPNIKIEYRKFRYEEFETELLNALAEDRGPDLFSIPEPWLRKYQTKLAAMPPQIKIGYLVEKTSLAIKKETVVEVRTEKTPTLLQIKEKYADTIVDDAVLDNQVFGLPLYLDTLVMFYNKDIINQAGISVIPSDWKSFQEAVIKATKFESESKILQAGTALGTGFNIERSFDILSVLMMQNGAQMSDARGLPTFFANVRQNNKDANPGLTALQFYSDFALPLKNVYSWNNTMPNSLTAFMAGKVGFFFGYNYQLPQIRANSRVNFGIAPIPQIAGNPLRNYADYWLEVVSKKSQYTNEAWDFLLFINRPEEIKKYLAKTNSPTAQKALIDSQSDSEDLHAASIQTLTAATWYRGLDIAAADQAFKEMIEQFLLATDNNTISNILSNATKKISQTIGPGN